MMNSEEKFFTFIINIIDKSSLSPLLDSIYDYEEYNNAKNGIASAQCIVVDSRNILKCDEEIISEKYKDDMVFTKVNVEDKTYEKVVNEIGITGFPTVFILDPKYDNKILISNTVLRSTQTLSPELDRFIRIRKLLDKKK